MTRRSRSSFDLRDALTTAEALSPKAPKVEPKLQYGGVPLVAFEPTAQAPPPQAQRPAPAVAPTPTSTPTPTPTPVAASVSVPGPTPKGGLGPPPLLAADTAFMRCLIELLEWLRRDPDVSRALVVDDEGLPLVGSIAGPEGDTEGLLAATGSVASAMKRLALATPGTMSNAFEGHVGEGPVLQLIGVTARRRAFVVGISRAEPFPASEVDRIRAAFCAVLGRFLGDSATVGGGQGAGTP